VKFQLQFDPSDAAAETVAETLPAVPATSALPIPATEPTAAESEAEPAKPSEGAEVVRLDRFRKK
jgi:hypothetical protein